MKKIITKLIRSFKIFKFSLVEQKKSSSAEEFIYLDMNRKKEESQYVEPTIFTNQGLSVGSNPSLNQEPIYEEISSKNFFHEETIEPIYEEIKVNKNQSDSIKIINLPSTQEKKISSSPPPLPPPRKKTHLSC